MAESERISLCMIVKDEEQHVGACLRSAASVVDEMIVVDTGSTDATAEVAASLGAVVHSFEWIDDFAAARNASLEQATGDWVLVLDADEELGSESRCRLRPLLESIEAEAFEVVQVNVAPEGDPQAFTELRITRLFRNDPRYRYEGIIREQIRPSIERAGGGIATSDLRILHHGYAQKEAQGASRAERNLALLQRAARQDPHDAYLHYQIGVTLKALGRSREAYPALLRARACGEYKLTSDVQASLYIRLGQLALQHDAYEDAARWAAQALQVAPTELAALYVAGTALVYLQRFAEAYPVLQQALQHPHLRGDEAGRIDTLLSFCRQMAVAA